MTTDAQDNLKQQMIRLYETNEWEKLDCLLQQHEDELEANPDFYLFSARVQTQRFCLDESEAWLQKGIAQFPDNVSLKQELAVIRGLKKHLAISKGE